jgi:hypothetical protein
MKNDELDALIRKSIPSAGITSERIEHIADMVLARLDHGDFKRPYSVMEWIRTVIAMPELSGGLAFAIPVIVSAVVGVLTGDRVLALFGGSDPISTVMIVSSPLRTLVY